jgi:YidC/Oxa1 family membrane protein insertase
MYDRKTWVVLAICGALLAANLYFSGQARIAEEQKRAQAAALQPVAAPDPASPKTASGELTVEPPPPPTEEETFILENDKVAFTLTNIGGGVKYADFKTEFEVGSKSTRVRANRYGAGPIGGLANADTSLENVAYAYKVEDSIPGKKAVFIAKLPSGLVAKKTFSLNEGEEAGAPYLLNFELQLQNTAGISVNLNQWSVFMGESAPTYQAEVAQQTGFFWHEDNTMHFEDGSSFAGGMFSTAKPSQTSASQLPVAYAGVTNQFFATVLRPREAAVTDVWARPTQVTLPGGGKSVTSVRAGLKLPSVTLNPNEPKTLSYLIFIGPKHNNMLRKMDKHWGSGWGDVMQYGWFGVVSRTLNLVLNTYHNLLDGFVKNWAWGLAIIFLTITVRAVIWPLHAKSTHTMKRMSKLQPEIAKLKEKYPEDPNKLNSEMMGLYKKYGINPLGGCLPMLIQIPIFFGFYRMLQYAVELRGQGFLWVNDLSQPDTLGYVAGVPINLLPIVMAITSFFQIKMTPMTGDKMQQNIMKLMPLMFFFFCYNFASALALYWTTQNIFSIGQTWLMNKIPEPELKARPVSSKKSWMQRMAERQAEMQKMKKQGNAAGMRDVTPDKKKRPPRTGG